MTDQQYRLIESMVIHIFPRCLSDVLVAQYLERPVHWNQMSRLIEQQALVPFSWFLHPPEMRYRELYPYRSPFLCREYLGLRICTPLQPFHPTLLSSYDFPMLVYSILLTMDKSWKTYYMHLIIDLTMYLLLKLAWCYQ